MPNHPRTETIAKEFHRLYEGLAPEHGYTTRKASNVKWEHLSPKNKNLMLAVVDTMLKQGTIS